MGDRGGSREQSDPLWEPEGVGLLRGIIDSSSDLILAKDKELHLCFCNEAFARLLGKRPKELIGKHEAEIGWIADGDGLDSQSGAKGPEEEEDREALSGKMVFVPAKRYRVKGEPRFFDITRSPVRNDAGEIVAVVCEWHDVTTFHTAVEELREAAERYRAMSEYSHEWEVWQDADGRILYMSPSFVRITGYSKPEFLGPPDLIRSIVHPDDRPSYEAHRLRTMHERGRGSEPEITFRILRPDGEVRWIEHYCEGVFRPDGTFLGRRATNRDITATKLAEEKLRASELKFRLVFENSPLGKSMTDVDGTLHVNQAFCDITGYTEEELRSKTWQEISHPDDIPAVERALETLLNGTSNVARFEKRYIHKSGKVVWAEVITALQRDDNGAPLFFITTINDITERKRLES